MTIQKSVLILGCRGIPAAHGGFETFAERLSLFLVKNGWHVCVYCQHDDDAGPQRSWTDTWNGVERRHIAVSAKGPIATLEFDRLSVVDAGSRNGLCLVLGYNSAVLLPYLRFKGRTILTNMDGIEWRRQKWSRLVRAWFWLNEWIAVWSSHQLIADHPAIADHLARGAARRSIVVIPYGGIAADAAHPDIVLSFGLIPDRYLVTVARIEPENNILPIVQAFSRRHRGAKLAVIGRMDKTNAYHRRVLEAAGEEVVFPGAIYDPDTLRALRFHARAYLHGHSVGGTNPSLVEALWAGNAVIAHDNLFNRWTAGPQQLFFKDVETCDAMITRSLEDAAFVDVARAAAKHHAAARFDWTDVLEAYERAFLSFIEKEAPVRRLQPIASAKQ